MVTSDASVMTLTGVSGLGCTRSVALATASLISWKAAVADMVHCRVWLLFAVEYSSELSRVRMAAQRGMNLW